MLRIQGFFQIHEIIDRSQKIDIKSCLLYTSLVALYITEFNAKRELPSIKMDMEKGEVVMEYSYFLKTSIEYDKKRLWFYIDALISPMFDAYPVSYTHLDQMEPTNSQAADYQSYGNNEYVGQRM